MILILKAVLMLVFSATTTSSPARDIIPEGMKTIRTNIQVATADFADQWHFIYTSFHGAGTDLEPGQPLTGRYFYIIHAVPLADVAALRKAQDEGRESLATFLTEHHVAESERLSTGGLIDESDPAVSESIRYAVTAVADGRVVLEKVEHLKLRKDGSAITPEEARTARQERSYTMVVLAGLGLLGLLALAFLSRRRKVDNAA